MSDYLLPSVASRVAARCSKCARNIGKQKERVLLPEKRYRVLCFGCFAGSGNSQKIHRAIYPECDVAWHDMYDHDSVTATRAGAERFLVSRPTRRAISAVELMGMQFPEPETAFDVVRLGLCTGQCLVADEEGSCECVCRGKYHAALANVVLAVVGAMASGE